MKQLTVRGFDRGLERRLRELARERRVSLNRAALILLREGAGLDSPRARANLVAFLDNPYVAVAPVTRITADRFARIAAALRAKRRPIPTNDIWVAAHAMETGAELLS